MRILAFETSAKAASVALTEDGVLLGETYLHTGLTHSQTLLAAAQALMEHCGVDTVDAAAAAAGPGSFTGVRIGVAAAKGYAWGAQIPCYGVSTLEAMALSFGAWEGIVCPVMDARRNQVYNALFSVNCGNCIRIREDRAISIPELGEDIQKFSKPIFLVGDGSFLCYNTLSEDKLILPPEHRRQQRACGVALAAMKKIAAGDPGDGNLLIPNYLRLSQAERERLEKEKK